MSNLIHTLLQFCERTVGAAQIALYSAQADPEFLGNLALGNLIHAMATEYCSGARSEFVERALDQQGILLPLHHSVGRGGLGSIGGGAARFGPVPLTLRGLGGRTVVVDHQAVGSAEQVGSRGRYGPRAGTRNLHPNLLKQILCSITCTARAQEAEQLVAMLEEGLAKGGGGGQCRCRRVSKKVR